MGFGFFPPYRWVVCLLWDIERAVRVVANYLDRLDLPAPISNWDGWTTTIPFPTVWCALIKQSRRTFHSALLPFPGHRRFGFDGLSREHKAQAYVQASGRPYDSLVWPGGFGFAMVWTCISVRLGPGPSSWPVGLKPACASPLRHFCR